MSMVMFVIGCVAVMAGVVMIGFGIPVSEFSFGNTLIVAGTTLMTGGLLVISLSAVVTQLRRVAEALSGHAPVQPGRPAEVPEPPIAEPRPAQARIPFPPKQAAIPPAMQPSMQPATREPRPADLPVAADLDAEDHAGTGFAPALRNPEAPPMTVEDEVSLSPQATNGAAGEPRHEPAFGTEWRAPPAQPRETPSYFDSMWPAKPKTAPAAERKPEAKPDLPRERETVARAPAAEPPRAAVLKSGVVDGMGYTLYVDGSIEAELPQGTLRFASIDELRSHLEKNG